MQNPAADPRRDNWIGLAAGILNQVIMDLAGDRTGLAKPGSCSHTVASARQFLQSHLFGLIADMLGLAAEEARNQVLQRAAELKPELRVKRERASKLALNRRLKR